MRRLRTQESECFNKFFELIQKEAKKRGLVFLADAGDVHEEKVGDLECEDMFGWLIPISMADDFEKMFINNTVPDEWDDLRVLQIGIKIQTGILS